MPSRSTPEGRVKARVDTILKRHNVWYFKPVSNGMGVHGIPDYICCVPPMGVLLAIECKANDGAVPTVLQSLQLGRIKIAGGTTFLATPSTVQDLDVLLTALTKSYALTICTDDTKIRE